MPTQDALQKTSSFTVASSDYLTKSGYSFNCWNDGSKNYNAGSSYTMGDVSVTLYFYYYNPATKQTETLDSQSVVDADGYATVQISHCSDYVLLPQAVRFLTLDTKIYEMSSKNNYEIGIKLMNTEATTVKVYSSIEGVSKITQLENGNYQVQGLKAGLTYIMFDVYDEKNKLITKAHASVRLTIKNGVNRSGDSWRQTAIF